jgi:GNAT superfamily N-acetyltransferase
LTAQQQTLPSDVVVEPFARHRVLLPMVAQWFTGEWPQWYGPGGQGDVTADVQAFAASETALPLGMLLFEGQQPVGAAALKAESIPGHTHLGPWAAAGYVLPTHRGRGLGGALLHALVAHSRTLGFGHIYCGTSTAQTLLARAGWEVLEVIAHAGQPLAIFRSKN